MTSNSEQHSNNGHRSSLPGDKETYEARTLKVYNSFSRKKQPFVPVDRKTVRWYCCGPTVYDVAHLGHARCYITFDIIRRILSAYFGYQVYYVINVTDIDDKIIRRARSNHLCDIFIEDFLQKCKSEANKEYLGKLKTAIDNFTSRRIGEKDQAKIEMVNKILDQSKTALVELTKLVESKQANETDLRSALDLLRDVIADEQDINLGHTVTDHNIFKSLTRNFENEFLQDMQRLDVLPPSVMPRVSEYIDECGQYIRKLELNGYAYRSGGSIYFDTEKFDASPKHHYAKLVREAYGHKKGALDEGEGELSNNQQDRKKSTSDFALWKKSKPGEPEWQTLDFDPGRPGWHIECSVMASKLLGENFDIHSGGCDLKFPHHDNEIAQAEAYFDTGKNWVNYFLHSGHLTISGCKMSKSLKNFITIRQALSEYTSRQLRFAFLVHGWTETLDYSPNTMNTALSYEKTFREFFLNTADTLRRKSNPVEQFAKWTDDDMKLNEEFLKTVDRVDSALCDNFDTRSALNALSNLVKESNKRTSIQISSIKEITSYVKNILSVFGTCFNEIDLDQYLALQNQKAESADSGAASMKYVEVLAQFRADVRKISKSGISKDGDPKQSVKQLLSLCDQLRDLTLPNLGVRLEDKEVEGAPYVVKFVDPETLAKEKALAEKLKLEKKTKQQGPRKVK